MPELLKQKEIIILSQKWSEIHSFGLIKIKLPPTAALPTWSKTQNLWVLRSLILDSSNLQQLRWDSKEPPCTTSPFSFLQVLLSCRGCQSHHGAISNLLARQMVTQEQKGPVGCCTWGTNLIQLDLERKPGRYVPVVSKALKQCEDKSGKDSCCLLLQNPTDWL